MRRFLPAVVGIFILHIAGVTVDAQDRGTLSVTATVVTSVGLVTDPNGIPRIVVANPAAPNDNVSSVSNAPSTFPNAERSMDSDAADVPKVGKGKNAILMGHQDRRHEGSPVQRVSSPSL